MKQRFTVVSCISPSSFSLLFLLPPLHFVTWPVQPRVAEIYWHETEPILRGFSFIAPHQQRRGVCLHFLSLCGQMSSALINSLLAEEDQVLQPVIEAPTQTTIFANNEAKFENSAQGSAARLQLHLHCICSTTGVDKNMWWISLVMWASF